MVDDDNCKLNNGNFEKLSGFFLFCLNLENRSENYGINRGRN